MCKCRAYKHIKEKKHATIHAGFTTIQQMMKKADPWHFGQRFLEVRKHGESALILHTGCNSNNISLTSSFTTIQQMMKKANPWHFGQRFLEVRKHGESALILHTGCNSNNISLTSSSAHTPTENVLKIHHRTNRGMLMTIETYK